MGGYDPTGVERTRSKDANTKWRFGVEDLHLASTLQLRRSPPETSLRPLDKPAG